jgi:hypothetical protein
MEQAAEVESTSASAASTGLRLHSSHGQTSRGNYDHQSTLHGSILQNNVKQGNFWPSMTVALVTRKRYTKLHGTLSERPLARFPPSKNKPRRTRGEA